MDKKRFKGSVDIETTGLSRNLNEIIQIAIVIFDDNYNPIKNFVSLAQPYNWSVITEESLQTNGITIEQLKEAPTGISVRSHFLSWWRDNLDLGIINPYGWNYKSFDMHFLLKWFGEENYFKVFHYRAIDVDEYLRTLIELGLFEEFDSESSLKLPLVCTKLGIPLNAHDALHDCRATLDVLLECKKRIQLYQNQRKRVKIKYE